MSTEIILTDWPKLKHISANLRGLSTDRLKELRTSMFHGMTCYESEIAGGYCISYLANEIDEELKFRGEPK